MDILQPENSLQWVYYLCFANMLFVFHFSIGGLILDFTVRNYTGIAVFQPVINGMSFSHDFPTLNTQIIINSVGPDVIKTAPMGFSRKNWF